MRGKLGTAAWTAAALAAAVTLWVLLGMNGSPEPQHNEDHSSQFSRGDPVAVVGEYTLYDTDLALVRAGDGAAEAWTRDQILASAAENAGLENPAMSAFVAARARQLYLRDLMVDSLIRSVEYPSTAEIHARMELEPQLYLIERHYHQIILADSAMADSVLTRLEWGQNFSVTAVNISLGQKAGVGGDLGFVTGAEMLAQGLPMEIALLDGLSTVIRSNLGWHIFKVSDTRALQDSLRGVQSAGQIMYETRIQTAIDSVLSAAGEELSVEVEL